MQDDPEAEQPMADLLQELFDCERETGQSNTQGRATKSRPAVSYVDSIDWIWQSLAGKVQERK
jgi:hypothetical protein